MMVGDEDVGTEPKQENNANDGAIHGMDEKNDNNDNNDGQAQPLANNGTHEDIVSPPEDSKPPPTQENENNNSNDNSNDHGISPKQHNNTHNNTDNKNDNNAGSVNENSIDSNEHAAGDPTPETDALDNAISSLVEKERIPPYAQAKRGQLLKAEVLYKFPTDKPVPPKVTEFCFPNGIKVNSVKRSTSGSSLNELLYGQPHLHSSSNSHVFYLTGEVDTLYGCCVTKDEFLRCTPNFLRTSISSHPLPVLPQYLTVPRCYCFLSRFPIFPMHFDVLFALLAQDRLITMTLESQALMNAHPTSTPSSPSDTTESSTTTTPITATPPPTTTTSSTTPPSTSLPGDADMEHLDVTFQKRLSMSGEIFKQEEFTFTHATELREMLQYYYNIDVLKPGQSTLLKIPGDIKKPTTFYCPMASNNFESGVLQLADWCLTPLFKHLSLENVSTAAIQEFIHHDQNLNTLSAVVLAMIPLLYPFVWQGIYIPVLPINLHEYLDAPVPFIMGLQSLRKRHLDAIIIDINANKLVFDGSSQPAPLPEYRKLFYNLEPYHKSLFDINNKNHNPFNNTAKQLSAVHEIMHTLQAYIFWLIKKVEDFFNANPAEISDSLSVEGFKQKFLATVSGPNKDFVRQFLDTQQFSHYMHNHMGPAPKGKMQPLG